MSVEQWDAAFDRLEQNWSEALKLRRRRSVQHRETVRTRWRDAYHQLLGEQQRLVEQGKWVSGPDDLLSIIGQGRRETYHCRVLAWLMDPRGRHGLTTAFVKRFLDSWLESGAPPEDVLLRVRSACEVVRPLSRADIVLTAPTLTVVVEAKIDAMEGDAQCDRLYRDFAAERGVAFLFLTPHGRRPRTATDEASDAFATLSMTRVREILRGVLERVEEPAEGNADALRAAWSYLRTLEREFR